MPRNKRRKRNKYVKSQSCRVARGTRVREEKRGKTTLTHPYLHKRCLPHTGAALSISLSLGYRSSMLMRDKGRARLTAATLLANPYKIPLVRAVTEMRGDEGLNCARQGCRDFLGDHACRGGHAADDRADTCAQAFHGTVMLELEYLCELRTFLVKNDGFPVLL